MLCKRLRDMLDPNMLQVCFRQASSMIQESVNLSQLLSPDEGLFYFKYDLRLNSDEVCVHLACHVAEMNGLWLKCN